MFNPVKWVLVRALVGSAKAAGYKIVKVGPSSHDTHFVSLLRNAVRAAGFVLVPLEDGPAPTDTQRNDPSAIAPSAAPAVPLRDPRTNHPERFADIFSGIAPWRGVPPKGFMVDFLGTLTDARFREMWGVDPANAGGVPVETRLPVLPEDGEGWFEAFNWVAAAKEARGRFVMVTLGACYGAQAVGSYRALQCLNPMPCKLVAVEPQPDNIAWVRQHYRDNGIDPADHWVIEKAISDQSDPVLFPVGAAGTGSANCTWTRDPHMRQHVADLIVARRLSDFALTGLLVESRTGFVVPISEEGSPLGRLQGELKMVSAVTLDDVLAPFDRVDFVESDLQHSEVFVFPAARAALARKVRRVHIGTHSVEGHRQLHAMFDEMGWEIVFSYEPMQTHATALGNFWANDGILTVVNPALAEVG